MAPEEPEFHDFYKYTPSKVAAAVFIVLFAISSVVHLLQLLRHRVWFFIPMFIGGLFEIVGYCARIISSAQTPLFKDTEYIIQSLFLLLAPALFAASIYMELGRIVLLLQGEQHALVRRTWMTKIFVVGDILSFVMQGIGGGVMSSGTPSNLSLGEKVIIGGLIIQLLFFGFFIFVSLLFHRRMIRYPSRAALATTISWRRHLYVLYGSSILVIFRSTFRLIEYAQGSEGALLRREVYLYIFDAALMWLVMALLNVVHPGEIATSLRKQSAKDQAGGETGGSEGQSDELRLAGMGRESSQRPSFMETSYVRHAIATRGLP